MREFYNQAYVECSANYMLSDAITSRATSTLSIGYLEKNGFTAIADDIEVQLDLAYFETRTKWSTSSPGS
ncbi:MAG: hypothetical protein ACLP3R_22405, partial [Candidatus Korobacteraceae bacterium]